MYQDVIIAGFGGQGVLLIGNLLAQAAMEADLNVTFIPVYGAEMRGGTANCTVVISEKQIGAPIVAKPQGLVAMNGPSLEKFQPDLQPDGVQIVNSSLIDISLLDPTKKTVFIPMNEIANDIGNLKLANMVALGAFVKATNCIRLDAIKEALSSTISERNHHLIPLNVKALEAGFDF